MMRKGSIWKDVGGEGVAPTSKGNDDGRIPEAGGGPESSHTNCLQPSLLTLASPKIQDGGVRSSDMR